MKETDLIMLLCLTSLFISMAFLIWNNETYSLVMVVFTLWGTVYYDVCKSNLVNAKKEKKK